MGQHCAPKWLRLRSLVFLGFLSAASYLKAENLTPTTLRDFSCGKQSTKESSEIDLGCASDLQNVDVWNEKVTKRRGSVKQNVTALTGNQPVRFQWEYQDSSGNDWLLSVSSNSIFKSNNGGSSNTTLTSTHGVTASSVFQAVNAYGKARLTDGTTNWILFDGTNVTVSTTSPKSKVTAFFGERIWASTGSQLLCSRFGDPEDWTNNGIDAGDSNSLFVRQNDGYNIRALKVFGGALYAFKDYSVSKITLQSDGLTPQIEDITQTLGTTQPNSVSVRENDMIWLAHNGYYLTDGVSILPISRQIQPDINTISQLITGQSILTVDEQATWATGSLNPWLSTSLSPGSLVFQQITFDGFTDNDFTSNPTWTQTSTRTTYAVSGGTITLSLTNPAQYEGDFVLSASSTETSGRWSTNIVMNQYPDGNLSTYVVGVCTGTVFASTQNKASTAFDDFIRYKNNTDCVYASMTSGASGDLIPSLWKGSASSNCFRASPDSCYSLLTPEVLDVGFVGPGALDANYHTLGIERSGNSVWSLFWDDVVLLSTSNTSVINGNYTNPMVEATFFSLTVGTTGINSVLFDKTTGYYSSSPQSLTSGIVNFGFLSALGSNISSNTYAVYTDTNAVITLTSPSTFIASQTVTNNQYLSVATASFVTFVTTMTRTTTATSDTLESMSIISTLDTPLPVSSVYYNNDYYTAMSTNTTTNTLLLVYDRNGAWTRYTGLRPGFISRYAQNLLLGDSTAGTIARLQVPDIYTDYTGNSYASYWISKDFDFDYPATDKSITRYYVTTKGETSGSLEFDYAVNRVLPSTSTAVETISLIGTGTNVNVIKPSSLLYSKGLSHKFRFYSNVDNSPFTVNTVTIQPRLETNP